MSASAEDGAFSPPKLATLFDVSENTIWRRVNDGSIPSFRIGRLVRVRREVVERLMNGEQL